MMVNVQSHTSAAIITALGKLFPVHRFYTLSFQKVGPHSPWLRSRDLLIKMLENDEGSWYLWLCSYLTTQRITSDFTKGASPAKLLIRQSLNCADPGISDKMQRNSCSFRLMHSFHHQLLLCFVHIRIRFFCHGNFGDFFPIGTKMALAAETPSRCSIRKTFLMSGHSLPLRHCVTN